MFEIGWTEMLVIAVVMIVVVGPKDLPRMLRTIGKMTAKMRSMAGDFQRQFNEALKEAELDEVKKSVDSLRSLDPASEIRKQLNPFEQAASDIRSGLDSLKSSTATAAEPEAHAAEPLKNAPAAPDQPAASEPAAAVAKPADPAPATKVEAAPVAVAAAAKTAEPSAAPAAKAKAAPKPAKAKPAAAAAKPLAKAAKAPGKTPAKTKAASKPAAAPKKTAGSAK